MITVKFNICQVGQGSANFVEIYDKSVVPPPVVPAGKDPTLVATLLLDFGSQKGFKDPGAAATVNYVVSTLHRMLEPRIAAMVLSHKDKDHISLVPYLLHPDNGLGALRIGNVFYSGSIPDYQYKVSFIEGPQLLENLRPFCDALTGFGYNSTYYHQPSKRFTRTLWSYGADEIVSLSLLVANTTDPSRKGTFPPNKPSGLAANTASVVPVLRFKVRASGDTEQFIATGDATSLTMNHCNTIIGHEPLDDTVVHVTAPHHGSFTTSIGWLSREEATVNPAAADILSGFAGRLNAKSVSASALDSRYKHPSLLVLGYFAHLMEDRLFDGHPGLEGKRHFVTVHLERQQASFKHTNGAVSRWPSYSRYATVQVSEDVMTTMYIHPHLADFERHLVTFEDDSTVVHEGIVPAHGHWIVNPLMVNWVYSIDENANRSIRWREHGAILSAAKMGLPMPEARPMAELNERLLAGSPPRARPRPKQEPVRANARVIP